MTSSVKQEQQWPPPRSAVRRVVLVLAKQSVSVSSGGNSSPRLTTHSPALSLCLGPHPHPLRHPLHPPTHLLRSSLKYAEPAATQGLCSNVAFALLRTTLTPILSCTHTHSPPYPTSLLCLSPSGILHVSLILSLPPTERKLHDPRSF